MKCIVLVIIFLVLITSFTYSQETAQPLELTIKSDKQVYGVGEEIILTSFFKNASREDIFVIKDEMPLLWCRLIVNNPDGIEFWYDAYPTEEFGPASPNAYIALSPNQSIKYFTF